MNDKPRSAMTPIIETAVLRESEETLRDLCTAFLNLGVSRVQVAMLLRAKAEELHPTTVHESLGIH